MKITFITIGKTQEQYLQTGIAEYVKRLSHFCSFSFVELPDLKSAQNLTFEEIKKREGQLIFAKIPQGALVFLLDERGKEYTSLQFSALIERKQNEACKELCFVIGGAYGFSQEIYAAFSQRISLSKMTFSHQMIRLFFVEQLYRAYTIQKNMPYHHE
ncbi:MAG: 23S rRNA (pseudouridine(1915)-N(3))-methyltransferase RlmH [Bacteroidales bacterium]|jgi:23S rRNA (pseudouridine1915-N3)-methyltransferase|nr:23S rRNA (pseudouridine(1915)-N(3))-methyltransferase RlmH [Bacteroidales bacterium]